jgi:hypothetical protein
MVFPDSSEHLHGNSAQSAGEDTLPATPLPRRQQALLNATLFVAFVLISVLVASTIVHGCMLKSTPLEVALRILTLFVAPLCFFFAKSPISLFCRMAGCAILAIVLSIAYEDWLHSPSFPRGWLDHRAQEWMREVDQQAEEMRARPDYSANDK